MKKINLLLLLIVFTQLQSQGQYYANALGKNGAVLKTSLHNIIQNHNDVGWPLWNYFYSTDTRNNNYVWDIYSDIPGSTPPYQFTIGTNQCGTYTQEGVCYNHEHTWPSTFFNDLYPARTDLHHVMPTDGFVNNKRSNFPFGKVSNPNWTSDNGSKLGVTSSYTTFTSSNSNKYGFEPIDSFKGDIARNYFYMSTRYEGEDGGWDNWEMANGATLTAAAITLLMSWHALDPVSQKEIDRNNAIYLLQGNRNPFIDYPIFADCIWGGANCQSLSLTDYEKQNLIQISPNPTSEFITITKKTTKPIEQISLFDLTGRKIQVEYLSNDQLDVSSLESGMYFIQVQFENEIFKTRFLKN